jgi:hypothetical protein
MEEPPTGYHFILLAEQTEHILPTILSRCIIQKTSPQKNNYYTDHLLFQSFTTKVCSLVEFSKIIDSSGINERESIELFNEIFHYWLKQNNKIPPENEVNNNTAIISMLKKASSILPMPGSSSIFWRNLYLNVHSLIINT